MLKHAFLTTVLSGSIALAQQPASFQDKRPEQSISAAWPANVQIRRLLDIGRGKAIIFSPDFAEPGNREFYERLGFLYIEVASWQKALNRVIARNYWHPEDRIETIILETHGTNGNGLKLQAGSSRGAARSYISIAALQEKLDGLGVRLCVIAACNAGRLLRPGIYKSLDPNNHDPLFLPATLGLINASAGYDPSRSKLTVARRAESRIETTSSGDTSELSPLAQLTLGHNRLDDGKGPPQRLRFVVSNLLIQVLIRDPRLKLTATGYTGEKSKRDLSDAESEALFQRFLSFINDVAAREYQSARGGRSRVTSAQAPLLVKRHASQAVLIRTKNRSSRRID